MTHRMAWVAALAALLHGTGAPAALAQHEGHGGQAPAPAPSPGATPRPVPSPSPTPPGRPAPTQPNLAPELGWPPPVMDTHPFGMVLLELFELRPGRGGTFEWDGVGWYGGDYHRLWLKSEGIWSLSGGGEGELQALYGRLISPFYDAQVGLRYDQRWSVGSPAGFVQGVIGLQGLSPYNFELEPALFVSPYGDVSARLTASRALLVTQRTYLEGRLETNAALRRIDALGLGAGLSDLDLGLRLIHQIRREFAPYVGVSWHTRFGETAVMAQQLGEEPSQLDLTVGVRWWY